MADMRICETLATQISPNLGINNYVFGMTCIVYSNVYLRYRVRKMLCRVMCELRGEGNVVYSDVCEVHDEGNVVYSDVCEVEGERNVVYSDVCLR
jgi:hypothetical protein